MIYLLPHLELQTVYEQLDLDNATANILGGNPACCGPNESLGTLLGDAVQSGNGKVVSTILPILNCPSDPGSTHTRPNAFYGVGDGETSGAKVNYDFSASSVYQCDHWARHEDVERRMFGESSDTRIAQVTDGLSNTIAISETLRDVYDGEGPVWGYRGWVMVGIDIGTFGINKWQSPGIILDPRRSQLRSWGHAGSLHGDAAHVLMADGSVHLLHEDTDQQVLEYLSAMADTQVFESPF